MAIAVAWRVRHDAMYLLQLALCNVQHRKVAACGECSPTVWAKGDVDAAIELEHLWDEASRSQQVDIQCAYPIAARQESARAVKRLCAEHTVVEIR